MESEGPIDDWVDRLFIYGGLKVTVHKLASADSQSWRDLRLYITDLVTSFIILVRFGELDPLGAQSADQRLSCDNDCIPYSAFYGLTSCWCLFCTVGEFHSEEHEAGRGEHSAACRSQPDSRHAGDRNKPPDTHRRTDAQTQRGGGQSKEFSVLAAPEQLCWV